MRISRVVAYLVAAWALSLIGLLGLLKVLRAVGPITRLGAYSRTIVGAVMAITSAIESMDYFYLFIYL